MLVLETSPAIDSLELNQLMFYPGDNYRVWITLAKILAK
jgi:hypothetical protein